MSLQSSACIGVTSCTHWLSPATIPFFFYRHLAGNCQELHKWGVRKTDWSGVTAAAADRAGQIGSRDLEGHVLGHDRWAKKLCYGAVVCGDWGDGLCGGVEVGGRWSHPKFGQRRLLKNDAALPWQPVWLWCVAVATGDLYSFHGASAGRIAGKHACHSRQIVTGVDFSVTNCHIPQ